MADKRHAILGPSSSQRWLNCPASVLYPLRAGLRDRSGKAAIEGTWAHRVFELMLHRALFNEEGGQLFDGVHEAERSRLLAEYSFAEMESHADETIDQLARISEKAPIGDSAQWALEIEVDCNHLVGSEPTAELVELVSRSDYKMGMSGTADIICFDKPSRTVHVFDYKYGRNPVRAPHNTQMMIYALGAVNECPFEPVRCGLHILQPRIGHFDSWQIEAKALLAWGERTLRPATAAAYSPDPVFVPGDEQCRWCRYRRQCPQRQG